MDAFKQEYPNPAIPPCNIPLSRTRVCLWREVPSLGVQRLFVGREGWGQPGAITSPVYSYAIVKDMSSDSFEIVTHAMKDGIYNWMMIPATPPIRKDIASEFFLPNMGTFTTKATRNSVGSSPKADMVMFHKS